MWHRVSAEKLVCGKSDPLLAYKSLAYQRETHLLNSLISNTLLYDDTNETCHYQKSPDNANVPFEQSWHVLFFLSIFQIQWFCPYSVRFLMMYSTQLHELTVMANSLESAISDKTVQNSESSTESKKDWFEYFAVNTLVKHYTPIM